ncbi:MAG: hypothetical protein ABFS56_22945 [Pseudomonadota bacterium]
MIAWDSREEEWYLQEQAFPRSAWERDQKSLSRAKEGADFF